MNSFCSLKNDKPMCHVMRGFSPCIIIKSHLFSGDVSQPIKIPSRCFCNPGSLSKVSSEQVFLPFNNVILFISPFPKAPSRKNCQLACQRALNISLRSNKFITIKRWRGTVPFSFFFHFIDRFLSYLSSIFLAKVFRSAEIFQFW